MENFLPKGKIISEDKAVYVDKIILCLISAIVVIFRSLQ